MASNTTLIDIKGVSKSFGGVRALNDVSLSIGVGEVHAVCGENGAGKSTLNKILSGSLKPDSGVIEVEGKTIRLGNVPAAEKAGIAIVHQESVAFQHLNAADNVHLMHEPTKAFGLWLDRPRMRAATKKVLELFGESFSVDRPLEELTLAQRQMVGIARAIAHKCRLLILDEPTASLSARETLALFKVIEKLKAEGTSILYVSHRLEEVFELSDKVTVLRDGRWVATRPTSEVDRDELIRLMVGREVAQAEPVGCEKCELVLQVKGLTKAGSFSDISFDVHAGEVVALAGLVGAGRSEVARAIFGTDIPDEGEAILCGKPLPKGNPSKSIACGLAYVAEDRQDEGLHLPMTVRQNFAMAALRKLSPFGVIGKKRERELSRGLVTSLAVKTASDEAPVESLSGGNQQKVLVGKWLATNPKALILDEPTRGVDVGAKAEVHKLIGKLAEQGVAVLVISSELPEVLSLAHRVIVLREGAISGELTHAEATQEKILDLALPDKGESSTEKVVVKPAKSFKREWGVAGLLALTILAVSLMNPSFLSGQNIRDMLINLAPSVIVASAVTLVILAREIDISVGSLMGFCAAVLGLMCSTDRLGLPPAVGIVACLGVGLGVGLLNGVLVAYGKVPSIIVTLGMMTVLKGGTLLLLKGEWVKNLPDGLRFLGTGSLVGIPISVLVAAAVALWAIWVAGRTKFGRRVYALGSNPKAAELVGLPTKRVKLAVFALTGLLTAVATLIGATKLQVVESGFGGGFEMVVVAAVVVGGTSIKGGRGTVLGTLFGATLLGIISTVLIFMKLGMQATYWEKAIQGAFILVAVLGDQLSRRREVSA